MVFWVVCVGAEYEGPGMEGGRLTTAAVKIADVSPGVGLLVHAGKGQAAQSRLC
jgi:hypothetical protein